MRVIVHMNNSAHNTLGVLFCIIYSVCDGASFASWESVNRVIKHAQAFTQIHPGMKKKLISN